MMTDIRSYLKTAEKPILLYGTGNGADKILDDLLSRGIGVSGVFASDGFVRKRTFRGFEVMSYSDAERIFGDFIVLTSFGSSRPEVIENILSISGRQELYSVDVPVYGDDIFDIEFAKKHENEIRFVYENLCDDFSRQVYENIIKFKLTGKISYLFDCETAPTEAFDNILKLGNDEIFADLGAFNGDTVSEFLSYVPSYRKIYAVEPDTKNFLKLTVNTENVKNIIRLNVCICDKQGEILFSSHGGRNASADNRGKLIHCDTLDNILDGKEVTYIKFDVEGLEAQALEGARRTVKQYKPKMLVSCYHRSEDIFALPVKVMKIRNDYNIAIRHYRYIPAWDTQFYFT